MRAATILAAIPVALMLPLAGCAEPPNSVSRADANTVQSVYFGTIVNLQAVDIRPGQTRVGAITGAIIGGAAGSTLGSSTAANVAGAAAGATVGGAAGSAVQGADRRNGVEFTIRLDNGDTVAVVQNGNVNDYRVGDRVRVTGSAGNARVSR
jgi:outer membrane lipoprotein SlyB